MNTLLEEMSFSVIVTLALLAFATWIVNVAYDSLGVDGTVTMGIVYSTVYSCIHIQSWYWIV